jgi:N-acetyl-gamma-glutamyl-phosphate reductase
VGEHRHEDEVKDHLPGDVDLHFVPHVIPVDRGIESAIYAQPAAGGSSDSIEDCLGEFAAKQPLIRYREEAAGIKSVAHTPYCDVTVWAEDGWVVIVSTLDNLGKGAASQAVQNANLMLGWPSETGLLPD